MVAITIHNELNAQDKPIGIRFRRKGQVSREVIWNVLSTVAKSNTRFGPTNILIVVVRSVNMPVGFGRVKIMGRQLSVMAHLKRSIIEVKAEQNCLTYALIIAIARLNSDLDYHSYRQGFKIRPVVDRLLETASIELTIAAGLPELTRFQEHFHEYKIVVYDGLKCDSIMFEGQVESSKRLNLLYDDFTRHYYVIASLTGAMIKQYVYKVFNRGYRNDVIHVRDKTCCDCLVKPPCVSACFLIPCDEFDSYFRSRSSFENHKKRLRDKKERM
jgi:hypothetical protein